MKSEPPFRLPHLHFKKSAVHAVFRVFKSAIQIAAPPFQKVRCSCRFPGFQVRHSDCRTSISKSPLFMRFSGFSSPPFRLPHLHLKKSAVHAGFRVFKSAIQIAAADKPPPLYLFFFSLHRRRHSAAANKPSKNQELSAQKGYFYLSNCRIEKAFRCQRIALDDVFRVLISWGHGGLPIVAIATFESRRMVNVNSVGIFCRLKLKKAVGGAHYDKAPPAVPECRRTFNLAYFFCANAQNFENLLTTAEKVGYNRILKYNIS